MHLLPRVVPTQHGVRKWEATYPRLTVFNRYKANWPEKYWASRSQGPIDAHVLGSHAHLLAREVLELQEPSGTVDFDDPLAVGQAKL